MDGTEACDARRQIEDLLVDYVHCIDDGEHQRWPEFFTEDGTYQVISRESYEAGMPIGVMLCEGRGMMVDRMAAAENANLYEPHTYCHVIGPPRIAPIGRGRYAVRSNFQVNRTIQGGPAALFATGKYLDEVTVDESGARFTLRRVVVESRQVDILLVFPL